MDSTITTVIPTYRRPQLLRRAILSVLGQTYPHVRVCVYDNNSGDDTKSVVEEIMRRDPRVRYHCHAENIGSFHNFNYGIRQVDTPYFSVLSDDDVLLPDFYATSMAELERYPDAIFCATQTLVVKGGQVIGVSYADYEPGLYSPPAGLLKAADGGTNTYTGTLYRSRVMPAVMLDESLSEGPAEQDFLFRVTARSPYVVSKAPGAIFVAHPNAMSSLRREANVVSDYARMLDKVSANEKIPPDVRVAVRHKAEAILARSVWEGGWVDIKNRDFIQAQKTAQILRDNLGAVQRGRILSVVARLCEMWPIYYIYLGLNAVRKALNLSTWAQSARLQATYGRYLQHLDMPPSA